VRIWVTEESRRGRQLTPQRKYGHIGWPLPATCGYAPAAATGAVSCWFGADPSNYGILSDVGPPTAIIVAHFGTSVL
jgi:hypothetical protein